MTYIVTYSKRLLTFKADTFEEASAILTACFEDQNKEYPNGIGCEADPQMFTRAEYLSAISEKTLDALDSVVFDNLADSGLDVRYPTPKNIYPLSMRGSKWDLERVKNALRELAQERGLTPEMLDLFDTDQAEEFHRTACERAGVPFHGSYAVL